MDIYSGVIYQQKPFGTFTEYSPHGISVNEGVKTNSSLHNHKDIEFKYILNDSGSRVIVGNNEYVAKKGDFITANSGIPHAYISDMPFDYVTIIFATETWISYGIDVNSIRFREYIRDEYIDGLLTTIVTEHRAKSPFYKIRVNNCLTELAIHMLRNYTEKELAPSVNVSRAQLSLVSEINEFIAHNYQRRLSIEEIADELGFNKSYMMRTYKKVTSMTILEKLYTVRCNHAMERLSNHKKSITEIAYLSGFESPSHFGKIYKKHTGLSPSEFRKKGKTK